MRLAVLAVLVVLLGGCSHSSDRPPPGSEMSAATLAKNCANPKWKEENLGLWYSVCRRPMRW